MNKYTIKTIRLEIIQPNHHLLRIRFEPKIYYSHKPIILNTDKPWYTWLTSIKQSLQYNELVPHPSSIRKHAFSFFDFKK